MPSHWIYSSFESDAHLEQGDILQRTDDLVSVLSQAHSFFCDERYVAFAIITQSCDLVWRNSGCKTEYIQLAVIRELESLLPRILEQQCGVGVPGVFKKESRHHAQQIIRKIINQNDQSRGLFYLPPDADVGIATPSVIMLRVSIALRRSHYDLLRDARSGRLASQYSNKLGWLCGNLYSRVGVPDWEDQENDRHASLNFAKSFLDSATTPADQTWVPESWIESAKSNGISLENIPLHEFSTSIKKYAPPEPLELIMDSVSRVSGEAVIKRVGDAIRKSLMASTEWVTQFIEVLVGSIGEGMKQDKKQQFTLLLLADTKFRSSIQQHVASKFKDMRTPDQEGIDGVCSSITTARSLGKQTSEILRRHLRVQLGEHPELVEPLLEQISTKPYLSEEVMDKIRGVASEAIPSMDLSVVDAIVSRLRNDQALRGLLRSLELTSNMPNYADD